MSEELRPIVLSLVNAGTPEYPRWRVADQFLRFYTGAGWSTTEEDGVLYRDAESAAQEVQRLLMLEYMGKAKRVFIAPVTVELYCDEDVTERDLRDWLCRVARLVINSPKHGNGPAAGSLGLCKIDWSQMEEV